MWELRHEVKKKVKKSSVASVFSIFNDNQKGFAIPRQNNTNIYIYIYMTILFCLIFWVISLNLKLIKHLCKIYIVNLLYLCYIVTQFYKNFPITRYSTDVLYQYQN